MMSGTPGTSPAMERVVCNPFASKECGFEASKFFVSMATIMGVIAVLIAIYFIKSRRKKLSTLRAFFGQEFVLDRLILGCFFSAVFSTIWCVLRALQDQQTHRVVVIVFFALGLTFLHISATTTLTLWNAWKKPTGDAACDKKNTMPTWVSAIIYTAICTSVTYVILGPLSVGGSTASWKFMLAFFCVMLGNCTFNIILFTYEGLQFFSYYKSLMPKRALRVGVIAEQLLLFEAVFGMCVLAFGVWLGLQVWGVYATTLFDELAVSSAKIAGVWGFVYTITIFMALSQFFIPGLMIWMELRMQSILRQSKNVKSDKRNGSSRSSDSRSRSLGPGSAGPPGSSRRARRERYSMGSMSETQTNESTGEQDDSATDDNRVILK